ncbi:MAG TPA: hypothetical protein VF179_10870, partial [Thermoanaerobaculia bacterium]|nr:hypothetical protein [Thermoanaerobaculia bacterium]
MGLVALTAGSSLDAAEPFICEGVVTKILPQAQAQARAQLGTSVDFEVADDGSIWLVGGAPLAAGGRGAIAIYKNPKPDAPPVDGFPHPTNLQADDRFGQSVAIDNGWLAVGAPGAGVVYLFERIADKWELRDPVVGPGARRNEQFGFSVALSGTTLVVGAPFDSDRGTRAGSAYVFVRSGSIWTPMPQMPELHAKNDRGEEEGRPFDLFGSSVAIDDDTLVIGAPFADDLNVFSNFGAVYVFKRDDLGVWRHAAKLTAYGKFQPGDIQFGASVAISEGRIAGGAPGDDHSGRLGSGSGFVFVGTNWIKHRLDKDPVPGEQLGASIDIDTAGNILVGAPKVGSGTAYLFLSQDGWKEEQPLTIDQPGAAFGQSVTIQGDHAYFGGPLYDDGSKKDAGAIALCSKGGNGTDGKTADISISKTDDPDPICPGDGLTYTIRVHNHGSAETAGIAVTDDLANVAGLEADPEWTCAPKDLCGTTTSGSGSLAHEITLPAGNEVVYTVEATVAEEAKRTITNRARIALPEGVKNERSNEAMVRTEVLPEALDLTLKVTPPASLEPGKTVRYSMKLTNPGPGTARSVVLTQKATGEAELVAATPPCKLTGICELGDVPEGASVLLTFDYKIDQGCPSPESIVSTTKVTSVSECGGASELEVQKTSHVEEPVSVLRILEFEVVDKEQACQGGSIAYKTVFENLGPNPACDVTMDQSISAGQFTAAEFMGAQGSCQTTAS